MDGCELRVGKRIFKVPQSFVEKHPGGKTSIINRTTSGEDCTIDYNYHSKLGRDLWKQFEVVEENSFNLWNLLKYCIKDSY